jgi:hypothetical protein
MKNEQLKRLIKEEIKNILKEANNESPFANLDRMKAKGTGTGMKPGGKTPFANLDPGTGTSKQNTPNTGQEKISGGDFNTKITAFLIDLKRDKSTIMDTEKQNLLDLFSLLVQKSREGNLTQTMEDRIKKILMLKQQTEPEV